jgi:hypothetical protein
MGVSTDAILAYGFNLTEEDEGLAGVFGVELADGDSFEFEEWLATRAGAIYPEDHAGIDSPEYRAYSEARETAIAACPVDVIGHCSYDYTMNFLAIRGTELRARRGYPQAAQLTDVSPEKIAAMKAFCAEHDIEWKEPAWHIFSMWG